MSHNPDRPDQSATPETAAAALAATVPGALPDGLPDQLLSAALERRLLKAIRRGASMEDIAELRPNRVSSPEEAIRALEDGNARFFSGQARRPEISANERRAQIIGQTPFAAVLACSDSRVPVELVFDQGLGDLFVVRVAGNVVGESGLGTLEYAIRHLQVQLVLVLGHEGCGAVAAAMLTQAEIDQEPEHLRRLIGQIQPSVQDLPAIRDKKARMREAVISNVRLQVHRLRQQAVIREAEASGRIRVIGGYYEIGSGAVDLLTEPEELQLD
ncbi:carbonic anhydrase [Deinococcus proteolyticus MRP]|uniref:Carbonic anhydrase n=1 Tax=Deinococcus proteolyticus (strain ATCC 35074 / DSM 20540 / JCM 6276 / NBRC 101906 / NCIMB 13154 / VKM Ac-1939 / CCM 2703 / MRP) TaxID=693977 RepID=F0RNR8_DEIPM|nr:carbonic anhydrase [Deinococcus proteolyticus MRP]